MWQQQLLRALIMCMYLNGLSFRSRKVFGAGQCGKSEKGVEPMKLDNEMMRCAIDRAAQASIVYNHILPNDKQVRSKYPNIMTENISLKTKYSAETFLTAG